MKKRIVLLSLLLIAFTVIFTLLGSGYVNEEDNTPNFNVKVVKHLMPNQVQPGAKVIWKQKGQIVWEQNISEDGIAYANLPTGTYDVYAYYPPPPNDYQSGYLLNHYHGTHEMVTIMLGPQY